MISLYQSDGQLCLSVHCPNRRTMNYDCSEIFAPPCALLRPAYCLEPDNYSLRSTTVPEVHEIDLTLPAMSCPVDPNMNGIAEVQKHS